MQLLLRPVAIAAACLILAACGGWSQVGQLTSPTPTAVIATVGQPYTTDSSGVAHTTVRAGADVVLTGTSSQTGPSGTGIPIISWSFQQLDATPATTVDLIERTSDTYSFTAPQVSAPTLLTFQLTVQDATGGTASAQAQVTVEPVRDADHFLTFLQTSDTVTVTAVTTTAIPADATQAYSAAVPFTITVQKLVDYTDNSYVRQTNVPVGPAVQYSGRWSAQLGNGGPSCSDPRSPKIQIPIPKLNLDDRIYASGALTGQRLSDLMQASDVSRDPAAKPEPLAPSSGQVIAPAVVKAQITISSAGAAAPEICVGTGAAAVPSATVTADDLLAAANQGNVAALYDTDATAHAYYATIDPPTSASPYGTRTTLNDWLTQNHFDPTNTATYGADAHAVYTNNYDLGLGRNMYMKIGPCDSGPVDVTAFRSQSLDASTVKQLTSLIGQCDVAAVVVNYSTLEAAAQFINPIAAVAMEYSAYPGTTGQRFVKFYVFAPDQRSGQLQRVTSVDLDHRGQKPVPQACVVCHGGTPAPPGQAAGSSYPATAASGVPGDVGAAFLPWDLSSFWYSDTDPGFSQKAQDAVLKATYTEANQADDFKLLNVGAYLTMADATRFQLTRELIEGWYGATPGESTPAGLPSSFSGSFVPPEWQPTTAGNPAGSATLYTDVFAHSCRMCHTAQVGYSPAAQGCLPTGATYAHQCPIGSYPQLIGALATTAGLVSQARMPFARRTMDRLWTDPAGDPSGSTVSAAGSELITALAAATPSITVVAPGTPSLAISPFPPFVEHGQSDVLSWEPLVVTTGGQPADGALLGPVTWQVCVDPGTGSCTGTAQQVPVIGAASLGSATFQIPARTGSFLAELDSNGTALATQALTVPKEPLAVSSQALPSLVQSQGVLQLDTGALSPIGGNGPLASISWWVSGLAGFTTASPCVGPAVCSVDPTTGITQIQLTDASTLGSSPSYTVNIQDATGATATPVVETVTVTSGLTSQAAVGYVLANQTPAEQTVASASGALDLIGQNTAAGSGSLAIQVSCDYVPGASTTATWGTSCTLSDGTGVQGMLATAGSGVDYTPPPGEATNSPDGSMPPGGGLQAYYRVIELAADNVTIVDESAPATLSIQVRERVSWLDVYDWLNDGTPGDFKSGEPCIACHGNGTTAIQFNVGQDPLYCELVGCSSQAASVPSTDALTGVSRPYVDTTDVTAVPPSTPGAPPSSVLIRHPANLDTLPDGSGFSHTGGNRCPPPSPPGVTPPPSPPPAPVAPAAEFQAGPPLTPVNPGSCDLTMLLEWIEDGAHEF